MYHPFFSRTATSLLLALVGYSGAFAAMAEFLPTGTQSWRYQLLGPSTYLNDCPPCARPSFLQPMRGSFLVTPGPSNPLFQQFNLTEIHFHVGGDTPDAIHLRGTGEWIVGGELAVVQTLKLHLTWTAPGIKESLNFESKTIPASFNSAGLQFSLVEVKPSPVRVLHLDLDSMPLLELWFSTAHNLTAAAPGPKPRSIHASEILNDTGRVVVSEQTIATALSLPNPAPESFWNLDAFALSAGSAPWISFTTEIESTALGILHPGDLVSLDGRRIRSFEELGGLIGPEPPTPDLGLDVFHVLPDGQQLFSTTQSTFSERLGITIGRGDIVSDNGQRWRSNAELLKAFHPLNPAVDHGLDALYVWPGGEVWFSTEDDVELEGFQRLSNGDLLSDTGKVVYRNLELVRAFSPLEDVANFGLDALAVISDSTASDKPPQLRVLGYDPLKGVVHLQWSGSGQAYQVERAASLENAFEPVTERIPGNEIWVTTTADSGLYRIRQW